MRQTFADWIILRSANKSINRITDFTLISKVFMSLGVIRISKLWYLKMSCYKKP